MPPAFTRCVPCSSLKFSRYECAGSSWRQTHRSRRRCWAAHSPWNPLTSSVQPSAARMGATCARISACGVGLAATVMVPLLLYGIGSRLFRGNLFHFPPRSSTRTQQKDNSNKRQCQRKNFSKLFHKAYLFQYLSIYVFYRNLSNKKPGLSSAPGQWLSRSIKRYSQANSNACRSTWPCYMPGRINIRIIMLFLAMV